MARIVSYVVESLLDHNNLSDLTVGDDHTQYALLAGRATPQQLNLGTASGAATGYLSSTSHATKGKYFLNAAGTIVIDESNVRIGIRTTPSLPFHILADGAAMRLESATSGGGSLLQWFDSGGTKYNWIFGNQFNINNGFELTPSTVAGGQTFSTPVITILQTGQINLIGPLQLASLTTTQRDAFTPGNGMIIYNTTTAKFQGYEAGAWVNLI